MNPLRELEGIKSGFDYFQHLDCVNGVCFTKSPYNAKEILENLETNEEINICNSDFSLKAILYKTRQFFSYLS